MDEHEHPSIRSAPASELGTILSIWAHPDDETYLAGGVMADAVAHGQRVVCVSATAGEHGTDDPQGWPPARLGQVRRWEAAAAMAVLGVGEHRFLGFEDGSLEPDDEVGIGRVVDLIEEIDPDTILTFGADGITFHPDHIAVHHWVTTAWHRTGERAELLHAAVSQEYLDRFGDRLEEWGVYMTDERPVGVGADELRVHLRLEEGPLERKLTALRAMATQTGPLVMALDADTYAALAADEFFVSASRVAGEAPVSSAVD